MFGPCSVIEREKQLVLSVRTRTSFEELPNVIGIEYGKIYAYMLEVGAAPSDAPFVGYYNMDMNDLDVEIGFPVAKEVIGKDEIKGSEIPEGKYATLIYTGPYSEMKAAYKKLSEWMDLHQIEPNYLAYEIYLNDPEMVKPEELETQILLGAK
ncbi:GyrI-like domain-containing protein [Gottschalkiaceae bacterium SANA]|nr:GyrI-like domain-containing protein [Gottschalkiaceae bacterium SANA]